jgi:tetratricopeptide (TPR) repeat protein
MDEARAHLDAALAIARDIGDRQSEGIALGNLGSLHARQHQFDEARSALTAGEALLRGVRARAELVSLLCSRAEAEHLAGDRPAALAASAEAERLAVELGAGPGSEAGRAIAKVRALLDDSGS